MAEKKCKLLYLLDYLTRETDEDHVATMGDLLSYLDRCGISAERKSVYDDLHLLQNYGLDIQTTRGKSFGYYLGERDFQLPELKILMDTVQASPFLSQKKSMELLEKLEQLTSRPTAQKLRRQVYVMNRLRTPNETLYYTIDGINSAINENRKVSFRYFDWTVNGEKAYRKNGTLYTADPIALCVDQYYYLIAYDAEKKDYRHYRVDRMENLTVTESIRSPLPEHFDLGEYVKTVFSMFNGKPMLVTMEFENTLLNAVIDRFGADSHMRDLGNGHFELSAMVEVGPTFYGWLFQFGNKAKLVAPQEVCKDYKHHLRETMEQY